MQSFYGRAIIDEVVARSVVHVCKVDRMQRVSRSIPRISFARVVSARCARILLITITCVWIHATSRVNLTHALVQPPRDRWCLVSEVPGWNFRELLLLSVLGCCLELKHEMERTSDRGRKHA